MSTPQPTIDTLLDYVKAKAKVYGDRVAVPDRNARDAEWTEWFRGKFTRWDQWAKVLEQLIERAEHGPGS